MVEVSNVRYDAGSEESEAALVSSLEELSGPVVKLLGKVTLFTLS